MVVEQHDGEVSWLQLVFELAQSLKGGTTAVTEEKAFLFSQLTGGDSAILVGDLLKLVNEVEVDVGRQDVLANALGDVRVDLLLVELSGLVVLLEDRAIGVHPPDLDVRILFFQVFRRSTDGSSRPYTRAKMGDHPAGLLPNLRAGGLVVRLAVRQVVVLVAPHAVRDLLVEALRHAIVTVGVVGCHRCGANVHFRPYRTQDVNFLLRLLVAHGANQLVPLDRTGQGETHPRVAAGALDDGASGLELAIALRRLDHAQGHAVLDAVAWVEVFHLCQDRTWKISSDLVQADHGRISDGAEDVFVNDHGRLDSMVQRYPVPQSNLSDSTGSRREIYRAGKYMATAHTKTMPNSTVAMRITSISIGTVDR